MAITRYRTRSWPSPWQELEEMSSRLNRVFSDGGTGEEAPGWVPAVNVEETKDELVLTAELPGMGRDDVEIELENNVLTIRGSKEHTREEKDEERRFHLWERRWGSFQRSFTLPRSVSAERIGASFENGVLTVHMPKVAEARSRRIKIGEGSANPREVTSGEGD